MNDQTCIFCSIVAKEMDAEIVFENEHFLAFLDINPAAPGHVQVIPKEHHRWVWDVPQADAPSPNIGDYIAVVQMIARALQGTFGTDAVWSRVMGDEVFHAHIWVYPNPHEATGNTQALGENAALIRNALQE